MNRKFGIMIVIAAMLIQSFAMPGVWAEEDALSMETTPGVAMENLLLGKPATASQTHDAPSLTADKITDGDKATRWSAKSGKTAWVKFDLEKETTFNKMIVYDYNARIRKCVVQGSATGEDAGAWVDLVSPEFGAGVMVKEIEIPETTYQFVRLNMTECIDVPSLWEVELYRGESKESSFAEDVASLTEEMILNGQDKDAVKDSLNLPSVLSKGTEVAWETSPEGIIAADGSVSCPQDQDTQVTLTARLTMPGTSLTQTKVFTVTVLFVEEYWMPVAAMTFDETTDLSTLVSTANPSNLITVDRDGLHLQRGAEKMTENQLLLKESAQNGAAPVTLDEGKYYMEMSYRIDGHSAGKIDLGMRGWNAEGTEASSTGVRNEGGKLFYYDSANQLKEVPGGFVNGKNKKLGYELVMDGTDKGKFKLYADWQEKTGLMQWGYSAVKLDRWSIALNDNTPGTLTIQSVRIWKKQSATTQERFDADVASLTEALLLNGQEAQSVTDTLDLPTTLARGTTVVWSSDPSGFVSASGEISASTESDKDIVLSAALTGPGGEITIKKFSITVKKVLIPQWEDEAIVAYDKQQLSLTPTDTVLADFPLPLTGEKGSVITWESDNPDAIEVVNATAKVKATSQVPPVTLTATIRKGAAQDAKAFVFNINLNLLRGKAATGSSSHNSGLYQPANTVDGDRETTRWASTGAAPQWLRYDFGTPTIFNQIVIYDYNGRNLTVLVEGSNDDKAWTSIQSAEFTQPGGSAIVREVIDLPQSTYRYVRLTITKASGDPSIYEVEAYYLTESDAVKDRDALNAATVTDGSLEAMTGQTKVLPLSGAHGSVIAWESSDSSVLSLTQSGGGVVGTVHPVSGMDQTVRLTATVSKSGCSDRVKTYLVTVKGERAGMFYTMDAAYQDKGLEEEQWSGAGELAAGRWRMALSDSWSRFYPLTKRVSPKNGLVFETELYPPSSGGNVEIALLSNESKTLCTLALKNEAGSWNLSFAGKTASDVTNNDAGKLLLRIELVDGTVRVSCNSVILGAQLLPDGVGINSIGLRSVDGGLSMDADQSAAALKRDSVLSIVADGLLENGFSAQQTDAITKNLNFYNEVLDGIVCSWDTSNHSVISKTGEVTRSAGLGATEVNVFQTISLKENPTQKQTITFPVHVLQADLSNELLGATVTANCTALGASSLDDINDGTDATAFFTEGNKSKPIELRVDAKWILALSEIEIREALYDGRYGIKEYQLELSEDGKTWTQISKGQQVGASLKVPLSGVKARYLRLTLTGYQAPLGIRELRVASVGGNIMDAAQKDLAAITLPPDGATLTGTLRIPMIGGHGSDITVTTDPSEGLALSSVTADEAPYYRVSPVAQKERVSVTLQVSAAFRSQKETIKRSYYIDGTGGGSGSSGGSGSGSGGGKNTGVVGSLLNDPPPSVDPMSEEKPFEKELSGHWGEREIRSLIDRGLVRGVGEATLDLAGTTTRAELAAMLVRSLALDTLGAKAAFSDVSEADWFAAEIGAAAEAGIVEGADGFFRPNDAVSREEMAKMIVKACEYKGMELPQVGGSDFTDKINISLWATQYVAEANGLGLMQGFPDGGFHPAEFALREQMMVIIYRITECIEERKG